jgi:very-short-patch-repair endonuclease
VIGEPRQPRDENPSPEWERGRGEGPPSTSEPRRFARDLRKVPTAAEDTLWQALRGRRLNGLKFKRQVPVLAYTVDFLCFERKLIVEIDGKQHDWYASYDRRRTEEIESQGFTVLRFTNEQVLTDLDFVLKTVAAAAARTLSLQGGPSPLPLSHPGEGERR